ncbi:putative NADH dehydrogenase [ubiquinone] 1 alpha subcomplex subunit 2 [Hypsibius exemplaris]|uniref:NADH dehydrogenase [ubiquinone] 1 alpha subcomplex subunit 2 n=1 Tax=Hypsibius exemplaris TaxID=2072580 RepID=A0A1W0XB58_HYPEX|nr:putative NADH dehydrogenase [ubiquinone] 1 alpha subcomplex subunit 2 [Hypsibius exemplaris]
MASAGVRALGNSLKELRIHICQKSPASQGGRDFMEKLYVPLKLKNPQLPILLRECSGIIPKIHARYAYGQETSVDISDMGKDQVLQTVNELASRQP